MSDFEQRKKSERAILLASTRAFNFNYPENDILSDTDLSSLETDLEAWLEKPIDNIINSTIEQAINDYGIDATVDEIKEKIGIDSGEMASGIAKQITEDTNTENVKSALGRIRANAIAVTTTTVINSATLAAISQAGFFDDVLKWKTEEDETVCEDCEPKNNELIEDVGIPPEHTNCRCWIE